MNQQVDFQDCQGGVSVDCGRRWTIIAAVLTIYFLYMLYLNRMQEEHYGSIKQHIWSFLHFPLHVVFVLVLQGASVVILWLQAIQGLSGLADGFATVLAENYTDRSDLALALSGVAWDHVFAWSPQGVDASEPWDLVRYYAAANITEDWNNNDGTNSTAQKLWLNGVDEVVSATVKTLFDSLSVKLPKSKASKDDIEAADTSANLK